MKELDIKLKKGNLINPLTGKVDKNLINSSEYDLEVTIMGKKSYYRLRQVDFQFVATPITDLANYKFNPSENPLAVYKEDIQEFRRSEYYKKKYPYRSKLEQGLPKLPNSHLQYEESYRSFFAQTLQKNNFNSKPEYQIYLPEENYFKRPGVLGYNLKIENVKNRYYILFADCIPKKGYYKSKQDPLWAIYNRQDFIKEKSNFQNGVSSICAEENYPLELTKSIFIFTNGNVQLTKQILIQINSYKEYFKTSEIQKFLKREFEKTDSNSLKSALLKILGRMFYQNLGIVLEKEPYFARSVIDYVLLDLEDINYDFNNKCLIKK